MVAGERKPLIADFVLVRLIGRGSYGDVWLAQGLTGIYRAIKVVYRDRFSDATPFEREFNGLKRFMAMTLPEAGHLALLHVGQNEREGFFYYVMELADDVRAGRDVDPDLYQPLTLRELRGRQNRLPAAECVSVAVELTRALASLHLRGLVHRDIKPSNIIIVGGLPKLADIGLVASSTEARTFVGTEGYVPPEGPGKPAADVFALGKVIYELSTGLTREDFPRLPEDLRKLPDRIAIVELNEVVLVACDPIAEKRYRDAAGMMEDLLALQAGSSLRQRKSRGRFARYAGVVALALGAVCAASWWWARPAPREMAVPSEARLLVAKAWDQMNKTDVGLGELEFADAFCKRACELEPLNAEAWAARSQVNSLYCSRDIDVSQARREAARADAERALRLAPNSSEARLAQASYIARLEMPTFAPEARRLLLQLLAENPDEPRALGQYALVEEWLDHPDQARVALTRLAKNPHYAALAWLMLGYVAWDHNDGAGYIQGIDRSIAIQPFPANVGDKLSWLVTWTGDLDAGERLVNETPASIAQSDAMIPKVFRLFYFRRQPDRALDYLNGIARDWFNGYDDGPIGYFKGQAYALAGRPDLARIEWLRAMRLVEERLAAEPTSKHLLAIKARLLVFLGDFGEAEKGLRLDEEARRGADWDCQFSLKVAEGKLEEAMDIFEQKGLREALGNAALMRLDPRFDPLRKNARFQAELARAESDPDRSPLARAAAKSDTAKLN